jgi:hypothetical protein
VIQERLRSHPELVRLSGTEYLQTVRVMTFVDKAGQCHIYHAHLKAIVGENVIDNYDHGRTGNLEAAISRDNGTLKPALTLDLSRTGMKTVHTHPTTGMTFEGFRLPLWPETSALVKEAAIKFLPSRAFGWDVALTPDGPVLIEGNWNADPLAEHQIMDAVLDLLSENDQPLSGARGPLEEGCVNRGASNGGSR